MVEEVRDEKNKIIESDEITLLTPTAVGHHRSGLRGSSGSGSVRGNVPDDRGGTQHRYGPSNNRLRIRCLYYVDGNYSFSNSTTPATMAGAKLTEKMYFLRRNTDRNQIPFPLKNENCCAPFLNGPVKPCLMTSFRKPVMRIPIIAPVPFLPWELILTKRL